MEKSDSQVMSSVSDKDSSETGQNQSSSVEDMPETGPADEAPEEGGQAAGQSTWGSPINVRSSFLASATPAMKRYIRGPEEPVVQEETGQIEEQSADASNWLSSEGILGDIANTSTSEDEISEFDLVVQKEKMLLVHSAALESALEMFSPSGFTVAPSLVTGGGDGQGDESKGRRGSKTSRSAAVPTGFMEFTNDKLDYSMQCMREINLAGDDLQGAKFLGSNLTRARLDGTNMSYTHLDGCKFKEAQMNEWSGHGAEATGCVFNFAHMHKARLTSAKCHRAKFRSAHMQEADFSWADMSCSDFSPVDSRQITEMDRICLSGTVLVGANLSGVSMREGQCKDAVFCMAKFCGATLDMSNLEGAQLQLCDFRGASLSGANFHKADLSGAIFSGADVANCNFSGADLRGINKDGAIHWDRCLTDLRTKVGKVHYFDEKGLVMPPPLPQKDKRLF